MATITTLYKRRTCDGRIFIWQIEYELGRYRTHHGQHLGKIVTSEWTEVFVKNTGKTNETTLSEQTYAEVDAKIRIKQDEGYIADFEKLDSVEHFRPMLAYPYRDKKASIKYPAYASPKLDGIRCFVSQTGMKSRNGKPFLSCPHIEKDLRGFFKKHPKAVLDGELYNHNLRDDFNEIVSLVKTWKVTDEDLKKTSSVIQYWIFDVILPDNPLFSERLAFLRKELSESRISLYAVPDISQLSILVVPQYIVESEQGIIDRAEQVLEEEYEGLIIKNDVPYEFKRTTNCLKYKQFDSAEFEIIDICEGKGNRSGMAGYAIVRLNDGQTNDTNIRGSRDYLRSLLSNKDTVIGKMGTVVYFDLTPKGKLRFPVLHSIRDYE